MVYVGTYALIYVHTLLGEGIVSRDGLPRGILSSGVLKMEKNIVQALKYAPNGEFWLWKFIGEAWENCKAKAGQNELKEDSKRRF